MGTATPLVPCPPPTRVVTSLLSLSITFCYTLGCPILRSCRQPKDGFHSKLLFFGKLSKALIWKKENNFFRAFLLTLSPRPVSSVWCFIQNHYYAHKPCSESHLQHARLKKKKELVCCADCSGLSICNCPKRIIHFGGGYGWSPEYIPTLFSALQNNKNVKTQTKEVPRWQEPDTLDPRGIYSPGSSKALSPQNASSRPFY